LPVITKPVSAAVRREDGAPLPPQLIRNAAPMSGRNGRAKRCGFTGTSA